MELSLSSGLILRPQKIVLYGPEGIGKTTMAASFPDPLFIDTEGGTYHLNVRRFNGVDTLETLNSAVNQVISTPSLCRTLVIDTADQAEAWVIQYILTENSQKSIESFGFGKGYVILAEEFRKLLNTLNNVIGAGVNVVITAHAKPRKFEQPEAMGAYDRWEMKLTRNVAPLLKEWADMVLFCNYKTYVVRDDNNKPKAQGGQRVMYTTHNPCWDAKNRHNLPEELPMEYKSIASAIPVIKRPSEQMHDLMERDDVTEEQLKAIVVEKAYYGPDDPIDSYPDSFITGWVIKYWDKIVNIINAAESANQDIKKEVIKDE